MPGRLLVTLLAACLALAGCGQDTGADSAEAAVNAYIAALNAKDTDAVQRLANQSPASSDDDGQRKVDEFGGLDIRLDSIDIQTPVSPYHAMAKLRGTSSSGPYSEDLNLQRNNDDRWHISIHQPLPADRNRPTSATDSPFTR